MVMLIFQIPHSKKKNTYAIAVQKILSASGGDKKIKPEGEEDDGFARGSVEDEEGADDLALVHKPGDKEKETSEGETPSYLLALRSIKIGSKEGEEGEVSKEGVSTV